MFRCCAWCSSDNVWPPFLVIFLGCLKKLYSCLKKHGFQISVSYNVLSVNYEVIRIIYDFWLC